MKRRLMTTLAIVIAVLMVLTCGAITVMAATADETQASAGKVARIGAEGAPGTVYYDSLSAAVDAAEDGATITVIANTSGLEKTIAKKLTITSEKAVEITGVSIKVGSGKEADSTPGDLTIGGYVKLYADGAVTFEVLSGTLTIQDNAYAECKNENYVIDNWSSGKAKIVINIKDNAELVGTSKDKDKGTVGLFPGNGSELNISGNAKITQNTTGSHALKIPTDAERYVNITGGTLTAAEGTIALYADDKDTPDTIYTKVNISGNTLVKATGDSAVLFYSWARNAEVTIDGNAKITAPTKTLYMWGKNASSQDGKITRNCVVNIKGGTVEATGSFAVYLRKAENNEINISGGTVTAKDRTVYFEGITDEKTDLNISGNSTIETKNGDGAIGCNDDTKNLNIDISGGTVHATGTGMYTSPGFNVKISGNAVIRSDSKWAIAYWKAGTGANVEISENAVLQTAGSKLIEVNSGDTWTVKGGTLEAAGAIVFYAKSANGSTINIEDGTVKSNAAQAIYVENANDFALNVKGGTIKSNTAQAIYVKGANDFTLNVKGGTISAPKWTVMTEGACTGAINVEGGTVEATNGNKTIYMTHSADNMVKLSVTGGLVSANITTPYDVYTPDTNEELGTVEMDGKHAIFVGNNNSAEVTISGGKVFALYDAVDIRKVCNVTISGDAIIEAKEAYATNFTNVKLTMTGGTVKAPRYALAFLGGENTVNMSGGSLVVTEHTAITRTADGTKVVVNISDDAKIYSAGAALVAQSGITLNISGGLIDTANTYKLAEETGVYMFETREGELNITGGTFILGGAWKSAQFIAHASANTTGISNVNGGLFINKNTANTTLFGSNVNFTAGRVLYGDNVTGVVNGKYGASKELQVYYGEDLYYFFTKYAGVDEFDLEDAGIDKLQMLDGAEIRLTKDSSGIRFTTQITEIEGATYGTIILPARYLVNLSAFTLEELNAKGIKYENIVATEAGTSISNGIVTINAALTNILPENYNTPFAAIAYVIIDGQYYYTTFDVEDNVRAVSVVAQMALDDVQNTKDDKYKYETKNEAGETVYSPYASSHRETLQGFVVASFNLTVPANASLMNVGNGAKAIYMSGANSGDYYDYIEYIEGLGFTQPSEMAIL